MDRISEELKALPDLITKFRVTSPRLLKKSSFCVCHHYNSFSSDWRFLKLADKWFMDEISDDLKISPDQIIYLRVTSSDC